MTLDQAKQNIENTKFSPEQKQRLEAILPLLEKHCLNGLVDEVGRKDSELLAEALTLEWENIARLFAGLKKRDDAAAGEFFGALAQVNDSLDADKKRRWLNLVLDARPIVSGFRTNFSPAQLQQVLDYEISFFWDLPREEIIFFLQGQLMYLQSKINLLQDIKVVTFDNDWDILENFSKSFSDQLLQNKEVLGSSVKKTVGEWIKEYIAFSPADLQEKSIVQIAEFLVKNPAVQKLSAVERRMLSDILKLYVWFLDPEINEVEMWKYKDEVSARKAEETESRFGVPPAQIPAPRVFSPPAAIPAAAPAPARKPVDAVPQPAETNGKQTSFQDVLLNKQGSGGLQNPVAPDPNVQADINKKIEELKKRVGK